MPASTNTGDSQKSRGGSRCPGLACAIVVLGVAMCARGEVPADAFGRELYYPDPEFCEIEEQKDRLWRDEQHLIWQETELCELKIKILQTLQIIDTFTGIPEPQIREELGRQVQQLKAQHEAVAKKVDWIASFGRMFEADKRHLAERDARYKDAVRFGNPSSVTSRRETWCRVHQCDHTKASQREADRIRHQNDLLEAQSLEWNRQTTLKKLEEMRGKLGRWEQATFSVLASGRLPPPPPAPLHDVEELKLVESKGHLFARWEDSKERFNIEGTSRGLNCFPDKEYMEWPWPISKEEVDTGMYMKSLSPRRELAAFLEARALCLKQHKHEKQFLTAKVFADCLRRKEGVDLDKVNRLLRLSNQKACAMAFSGSNQVIQALASTNSWRATENERGKPGIPSVFAVERFDSK